MTKVIERKEVLYYEKATGTCPYVEWRNQLDVQTQAILAARISRLEAGNPGQVDNVFSLVISPSSSGEFPLTAQSQS